MDTAGLKKFAQAARRTLMGQVDAKLTAVLALGSAERREFPKTVQELEKRLSTLGERQLIERVAYLWFNRLTALRFMDMTALNRIGTVSPAEGRTQPEILAEAAGGYIDADMVRPAVASKIAGLLDGSTPSHDPQGETYRHLLVATCNHWHAAMPFLFEKIADYSELLMPDGLLATDSVLAQLREVMTEEACQDVEVIGWLYQFYISEKKDQVFAGLKKNQKITAENIPAATQLFTPHWIVRYLVENSLGRLWLLNRPGSKLAGQMEYYIAPEEPETDFLKITKPEEIRICDPAAGSGHMLTYAFDLLYAIYEEEGYDATEIPALILTHNLTGVEIDDRAGALAAFALAMKAAGKLGRRRFLRMEAKPDICVLQNVSFTEAEIQDVAAVVGKDLYTDELRETLGQFEQAKNFGSLIVPKLRDPAETLRVVEARDFDADLLLKEVQGRVVAVLRMAEALSPKYHVVVANPPYIGHRGMNTRMSAWLKSRYPDSKTDTMTAFMERSRTLVLNSGIWGMLNLPSWMFLGSFEELRRSLLQGSSFLSLLHLGRGLFGSDFGTVAFVVSERAPTQADKGVFRRMFEKHVQVRTPDEIQRLFLTGDFQEFLIHQADLQKVPSQPIAYWISPELRSAFVTGQPLDDIAPCRQGIATAENSRFLRAWHEVSDQKFGKNFDSRPAAQKSGRKWFPYNKGGEFRRWYGNNEIVVNWENDGQELWGNRPKSVIRNPDFYFRDALTWTFVSSAHFGVRLSNCGALFDVGGSSCFPDDTEILATLGFLASKVSVAMMNAINPTLNFQVGNVASLGYLSNNALRQAANQTVGAIVDFSKSDWDAYETSWDFTMLPLLAPDHRGETLEDSYATLRAHWQSMTDEMQRLEEENNRIFIDAYGLQDELTAQVPIEEITLTCNAAYRYGVKGSQEGRETRLRADTMAEFLSYAVGCMFGRYSLDAPGLILANQGETLEDYLARMPDLDGGPSFMPDDDNVIPILEGDWFPDDITERFRKFLRVTFGEDNFAENLRFVEDALGKSIRKYFTKDFYNDHIKRYKKRPIFWMFSSPKGSFNALIYMHRYRPDTISVILNDYLREYRTKLTGQREQLERQVLSGTASEQARAQKQIDAIAAILTELDDYERDTLYPLATEKLDIDLDDGVKVNYPKFGAALKPVKGLS